METIFVNLERCIGCRQCEFACAVEHSRTREPALALWEDPLPKPRIHVEAGPWLNTSFPNRCRHCDPAPCEVVCPTGAIAREPEYGVVLVAAGKCIACAMCAVVCPFSALTFHPVANGHPARVAALKCDGCIDRLRRGEGPACVEACKTSALVFGELNELIAVGRLRQGAVALAASAAAQVPDPVAGWRSWGEAATSVAKRSIP